MNRKWIAGVMVALACGVLLWPQVNKTSDCDGWVRSAACLRQIGLALRAYCDANNHLPPAAIKSRHGKPLLSWRVAVLPYLEQEVLYGKFKLDEPWDGPHNRSLVEKIPSFLRTGLGGIDPPGQTRYQVFVGPGTAFERDGLAWDDFPRPAETLLVVEAGTPVPWTKPADLVYDPDRPLPALGGVFDEPVRFLGWTVGRRTGVVGCFADGRTRFVAHGVGEERIRGLILRDGSGKTHSPDSD